MPFIPIPNVAQVELIFTQDTQRVQNVLHFEYPASPGTTELTNLANDVAAWWNANIGPLVSGNVLFDAVAAIDLSAQFAEAVEVPISGFGGIVPSTDPMLPNNVTVAVKKSTGLRGRSHRGRLYHIGLTESQVQHNRVIDTHVAALESAYTTLLTYPFTDVGWVLVVASRYTQNAPRAVGITTPVIAFTIDPIVDSQRRRLPGRGQ